MEAGNVYRIIIAKDCEKSISKSPRHIRQAVEAAFEKISHSPYSGSQIKALQGEWQGYFRYRVGPYRLIYRVDDGHVTVFAIAFGSRGDIYK